MLDDTELSNAEKIVVLHAAKAILEALQLGEMMTLSLSNMFRK